MYAINGYFDTYIKENCACVLCAAEDRLYIKSLSLFTHGLWSIPYDTLRKIYAEDSELNGSNYEFLVEEDTIELPYPKDTYLPQTVTVVFEINNKKSVLTLISDLYNVCHNATEFDHYAMMKANIFAFIHTKAPQCEMYHYCANKKIRSAKPYHKQ